MNRRRQFPASRRGSVRMTREDATQITMHLRHFPWMESESTLRTKETKKRGGNELEMTMKRGVGIHGMEIEKTENIVLSFSWLSWNSVSSKMWRLGREKKAGTYLKWQREQVLMAHSERGLLKRELTEYLLDKCLNTKGYIIETWGLFFFSISGVFSLSVQKVKLCNPNLINL